MELVQPHLIILHASAVPAKIVVVALSVGNVVHGSVRGGHGHMGNGGQPGRIQLLGNAV